MRVLVTTGDPATFVRFEEVEPPDPGPAEALVEVHSVSLNRGEANWAMAVPAGTRVGWDLAGIVVRAPSDGSGPDVGSRVVGMMDVGPGRSASPLRVNTSLSCPMP